MVQLKKKTYALLALLMVAVLVLPACGSSKTNDSKNAAGENSSTSVNEGDGAAKLKPYKLTLVYPGAPQKDLALVQEEMSKYLTEKINATIELKPIDWGSWTDKTNLMKISGESFDLMFTAGWFNYALDVSKGES